ncbi:N(4)-(beta-N-acetylglucosaminyl)-L-asparaginase [Rurimicrobium arvi]|uniref:N(4)-(Beta-N-acetylglucosaminyl)-L-asparaginase n=1 Tax=Rurimicrobium arvi TaxID=2049916 RepID=A0ABP8N1S4_9BACT
MDQNSRRKFIKTISLGSAFVALRGDVWAGSKKNVRKPIVLSTWYNQGTSANAKAWEVLSANGRALDAVEQGVKVTESEIGNCCVGLGANPDRDGIVTLDASIMDEFSNCGSVASLEQIEHPISVARLVMEKTPHVMLVGQGAQKFAVENGFALQGLDLSPGAEKRYKEWLKESKYHPVMNIERGDGKDAAAPPVLKSGEFNHDTIGMIALDAQGNLSGACTTSGMAYKMRGRIGDSPIIGAGLYVDNEVGAATATGTGEEVIRICGSHLVVEFMRQGYSPEIACKKAVERIMRKSSKDLKDLQVGFLAINKYGDFGAYAIHDQFDYAVYSHEHANRKFMSKHIL